MAGLVSAVVLAKNEAKNIAACLESLSWCDEIIVIDDHSDDATVSLAKKAGATVYEHELHDNFAAQRNFGLEKATSDWVLFVDADEQITLSLQYEILNMLNDSFQEFDGFMLRRLDTIWGRKLRHGESGAVKLLRMAKKGKGEWVGPVHEVWQIKGKIGELQNPLDHFPHQTIAELLREFNQYTDIRAHELHRHHVAASWQSIILYPLGKFLKTYFLQRGFLDGIPGLVFAIFMSFHSYLVRGKLYHLSHS